MTSGIPTQLMTVGELSRRTGVPIKALREYTDSGLIYTEGRSQANYRLFNGDALRCVQWIEQLRGLGLTLAEIRDLTRDCPQNDAELVGPRLAGLLHPFAAGAMREIHYHDLPWPTGVLADLVEAQVRLRVTLSYFIEPNPGRRGWQRRYSYASYGLRFDLRRATESNAEFQKRINEKAITEDEQRATSSNDTGEWFFGPDHQRAPGSLHTDIWIGNAADLAQRGALAVFPVTGWWKENKARDRSEDGARYGVILSIETPDLDVDVWTPVAQQINAPVTITTTT